MIGAICTLEALWLTRATTLSAFAETAVTELKGNVAGFITIDDESNSNPSLAAELAARTKFEFSLLEFKASLDGDITLPGDAQLVGEAHLELVTTKSSAMTFDLGYAFDRDYDADFSPLFASIETTHEPSAAIGAEWRGDSIRLNADAEASMLLNEDLQRINFSSFNRSTKDYLATEAALRLTLTNGSQTILPFIEVAHVGRHYLEADERDYSGPELISGIEIESPNLTGQAGAIFAWRKRAGGEKLLAFGPYLELVWASPETQATLALATTIDQDEGGDPRLFRVHSGTVNLEHQLDDGLKMQAKLDVLYEDFRGAEATLTLTPELALEKTLTPNLSLVLAASAEWEKSSGEHATTSSALRFGLKAAWP